MAGSPLTVGARVFPSKASATAHYKAILDAYRPGEVLSPDHHESVRALVYRHWTAEEVADYEADTGDVIESVVVDLHPEFRSTKCFFLVGPVDGKQPFSYRLAISGGLSDDQRFSRACRHAVADRLRDFKKERFRHRPVRCALTRRVVEWEECQVDHKSPVTFSVIVRSFVVANGIDTAAVEYLDGGAREEFADRELARRFEAFHKSMAVLRLVANEENARRSGAARIKPTARDGTLAGA